MDSAGIDHFCDIQLQKVSPVELKVFIREREGRLSEKLRENVKNVLS